MTGIFSNFASLAYQESGAPQITGPWSLLGNLDVSSAFTVGGVAVGGTGLTAGMNSGGAFFASSGYLTTGVSSFGQLNISSGIRAPATSSFGTVDIVTLTVGGVTLVGLGAGVNSGGSFQAASGYTTVGVASYGSLNLSSLFTGGGITGAVASLTSVRVASGFVTVGIDSSGTVNASSLVTAPGMTMTTASVFAVNVASGITGPQANSFGSAHISSLFMLMGSETSPGLAFQVGQVARWGVTKAGGFVTQPGSMSQGFNCVASRISAGLFRQVFSAAMAVSPYAVTVTPFGIVTSLSSAVLWTVQSMATTGFYAAFFSVLSNGLAKDPSSGFMFHVIGQQ
jgi:hypothetical protein